jgi:hypothetical protein
MWRTLVWSKALKVRGVRKDHPHGERLASARCFGARDGRSGLGRYGKAFQHQEGNDAGDGERLHERSKALKGEPQERIRHETRPAGSGRTEASGG